MCLNSTSEPAADDTCIPYSLCKARIGAADSATFLNAASSTVYLAFVSGTAIVGVVGASSFLLPSVMPSTTKQISKIKMNATIDPSSFTFHLFSQSLSPDSIERKLKLYTIS